ncbi:MAG: cardiolipin synthase [Bacilli bacterium]|jgi:cardiolipin synthase|nr:cardiolipin synthase [Bacilli bacterium]
MKNFLKMHLWRLLTVFLLFLAQIAILVLGVIYIRDYYPYLYLFFLGVSIIVVLSIIGNRSNPSYKISWLVLILIFPVFGGFMYLMFGNKKMNRHQKKRVEQMHAMIERATKKTENVLEALALENLDAHKQSTYIKNTTGFGPYQNCYLEYFRSGESFLKTFKSEIGKAKRFIFIEYFILAQGEVWNSILNLLVQKVKEGVDVRVIYDDMGSISSVPHNYDRQLRKLGIQTYAFNRFLPFLNARINNRDHRKMLIIDGSTAFTGGINLADEYFNLKSRFGYWKDNVLLIRGDAVSSMTLMFLTFWSVLSGKSEEFEPFLAKSKELKIVDKGFIQPYADTPLDDEAVGENVYLNMMGRAKKRIFITTPYLILDNEMIIAFSNAAKQGIDVRIVTPAIPDKKLVFQVTRSYYRRLIEAGVKIYEYIPGFIHQKVFLADDDFLTIGTINLDYRSLYLHFENGVWIYKSSIIQEVSADFDDILANSRLVALDDTKSGPLHRLWISFLRGFATLL